MDVLQLLLNLRRAKRRSLNASVHVWQRRRLRMGNVWRLSLSLLSMVSKLLLLLLQARVRLELLRRLM